MHIYDEHTLAGAGADVTLLSSSRPTDAMRFGGRDGSVGRSLNWCGCRNVYVDEYRYPRLHVRPNNVVPGIIIPGVIVATIVITIMVITHCSFCASLSYYRQPQNNRRTSGCAHTGGCIIDLRGATSSTARGNQTAALSEPSMVSSSSSGSSPRSHPAEHLSLRITALG